MKLKLDLFERSVRRLDLNTTETIIFEDMKMLSRLEFTYLNTPSTEVNRKLVNSFTRLSMASLIVSCIMLAPLLGSLICVMCLLNDPPEAPPEDYYGPIDHGLQRFKRFYGRHIVWYRVSWLLIFILGVWAFRKRLETVLDAGIFFKIIFSISRWGTIDGHSEAQK